LMIHKRGHDMGKHDVGRRRGLYKRVVVRRRRSSFVVVRRMYVVDVPIMYRQVYRFRIYVYDSATKLYVSKFELKL
jgi:hypothetical protein